MGKKGKRKTAGGSGSEKKVPKNNKDVLLLCTEILDVCAKEFPLLQPAQWEEFLKIHGLVEQIRDKQSGECISWENHSRDDSIDNFLAWFTENGGIADKVQIHKFVDEGYGLIAVDDIKDKENFVTVPKKMMMTLESAKKTELGPLIAKDHVLTSMPHAAIALHVLLERLKTDSWWSPYLNILPSSYSTSLYFTPEDLEPLQGTCTIGDAVKPYRSIARQYAYFYRLFYNSPRENHFKHFFTFDDFRWAVSTVMTRQNQVPVSDTESIKALIPMWDMCNHTNGAIETGYDTTDESCKSFAIRPFAKADQVLIFYGKRNNADLLFHNGFVFPDNEHDFVNIHLGVSRNDKLYAMKAQILSMVGMDACARPYAVLRGPEPVSPELRTFLRIFSMDHDELKIRLFNPERKAVLPLSELPNPQVMVSDRNELQMWHYLLMRLNLILQQYKTSVQDDEQRLQTTELSHNAKNCLLLRLTERQILSSALQYAKSKLDEAKTKIQNNQAETVKQENEKPSLEDQLQDVAVK